MNELSESEILEKLKLNKPSVTSEEERRLKLIKCRLDAVKYREWLRKVEELRKEALEWFPVSKITNTPRQAKLKESIGNVWETVNCSLTTSYGSANENHLEWRFQEEDRRFAEWEKEYKQALSNLEKKQYSMSQKTKKVEKAILYLQEKGLKFCVDFGIDNCVEKANEVALDLEINKYVNAGKYISFNGNNCEDECLGWKPQDRRCQCGNRRVSFDWEDFDFEHPYIYAQAW